MILKTLSKLGEKDNLHNLIKEFNRKPTLNINLWGKILKVFPLKSEISRPLPFNMEV